MEHSTLTIVSYFLLGYFIHITSKPVHPLRGATFSCATFFCHANNMAQINVTQNSSWPFLTIDNTKYIRNILDHVKLNINIIRVKYILSNTYTCIFYSCWML